MRVRGLTLLPDGRFADRTLLFDDDRLVDVRAPTAGDPAAVPGFLVPGLINAHTHLELSWVGTVPGGRGLPAWIEEQMRIRRLSPPISERLQAARRAAAALVHHGVAAACDICGEGSTENILREAGLSGIVQVELLGLSPAAAGERARAAASHVRYHEDERTAIWTRPTAHAPYSTLEPLARAALAPTGAPASVHLAEDEAEVTFLESSSGPFADLFDRVGIAREAFSPGPGGSPGWLSRVGGLRPDVLVVHGVTLRPPDLALLADHRVSVVLCVRSNLHISGRVPDVPAMLRAGLRLALGTDSLASSPDLDVVGEILALRARFPDIDPAVWWRAASTDGARCLRLAGIGSLTPGNRPGLVQIAGDPNRPGAERTWLVAPGPPRLEAA